MSEATAQPHLIAIDIGTLSARAGLFDASGRLITARNKGFELRHPAEHHAVYRMDDIWDAVCDAVRAVVDAEPAAARTVVGLAVDATSSTVFEATGARPLDGDADVICWMDHRGEAEALEISGTRDRYLNYIGGTCSPEMYLPKILWLKRHRPEVWTRVIAIRDLTDEVARRLTGVDRASICGLTCKFPYLPGDVDPWRHDLLARLGIADLVTLGALSSPPGRVGDVHGQLSGNVADALGLPATAVVAVGLIDAEAGTLGVLGQDFGTKMNRTLALIGGTSTSYMAFARDERRISGVWGPFKDAIIPDTWMHEAGQSISGAALDAVLNQHPASPGAASSDRHAATVAEILAILDTEGPAFAAHRHIVPDWLGNRAPLGDGNVRALVTGIGLDRTHRAFLEHYYATARALALQSRHIVDHLNAHGYAIDRVCLSGGHTKNPLLVRLYRDALGADLVTTQTPEPVLLGTAMVAAVASGLRPDLFSALDAWAPAQTVHRADPAAAAAHKAAYRIYRRLFETRGEIAAMSQHLGALPGSPASLSSVHGVS